MPVTDVKFDGISADELFDLTWEEVEILICRDEPVVFKLNDADVLAQFGQTDGVLTVQFSVVEGGGEGILKPLLETTELMARKHKIRRIIWQVHAVNCEKPNAKLQRILIGFGFQVVEENGVDSHFEKVTSINDTVFRRR